MVKPDVKHNYYSDLEVPTTASIEDIRRSYHKLALQYHPDRNAGREAECVPRFQAIQAAHEVLGDPVIKARYDQDRRKAGLYPPCRPNTPNTGNPYTASSNYPPPPRRTQPGTWQRPNPTSNYGPGPQHTGADRFTNFPRPNSSVPRKDPAANSTQQFRAWQNMNNGSERPRSYNSQAPNPQPQTYSSPNKPRPQRPDARMPTEDQIRAGMNYRRPPSFDAESAEDRRSAWQAFQQTKDGRPAASRTNTPRTPKKPGGFDPNAPGSDERPAPQSGRHYFHRHRSEDFNAPNTNSSFPPPPPPPPQRDMPSKSKPDSPVSPKSGRFFRNNDGEDNVPFTESNRKSTPYSTLLQERTSVGGDGLRRSASTQNATKLQSEKTSNASRARSNSPRGRRQSSDDHKSNSSRTAFDSPSPTGQDFKTAQDFGRRHEARGWPARDPEQPFTTGLDRPKKTPKPPSSRLNSFSDTAQSSNVDGATGERGKTQPQPSSENIFSFPINHDTFNPTNGKERSEENINTQFSPNGWNGSFTGSSDYFQQPTTERKVSPGRRSGQRTPQRSATMEVPSPGNAAQPRVSPRPFGSDGAYLHPPPPPPPPPSDVKFSQQEWEKTFKDASWTWSPNPPQPPIGSKGTAKSRSADRKTNKTQLNSSPIKDPAEMDKRADSRLKDDDGVVEEPSEKTAATTGDADAMDIDSTPPGGKPTSPAQQESTKSNPTMEARFYPVHPSTWRQEQLSQSRESRPPAPSIDTAEDATLGTNLDDLRHVEPISQGPEGLKSFADLSSALPFQSQSSNMPPTKSMEPQKLETPPVPKAPEPPHKLTKASWHTYCQAFGIYIQAFQAFNKTMLAHFEAREKHDLAHLQTGMGWLEAGGDTNGTTTGFKGFASYYKGVCEDEYVREVWNIGCEKHAANVKEFDKIRERTRYLSGLGHLLDR